MVLEGDDDPEGSGETDLWEGDWDPHLDADQDENEDEGFGERTAWDLRNEPEKGDARHRAPGSSRVEGAFYKFHPPQETASRRLVDFDPETCMHRGMPRHAEKPPERCVFNVAMFYGRVTECDWMTEDDMAERLWRERENLDIFIGRDMHDETGPWRIFLVHRTYFGSRIEEFEIPEGK